MFVYNYVTKNTLEIMYVVYLKGNTLLKVVHFFRDACVTFFWGAVLLFFFVRVGAAFSLIAF